MHGVTQSVIIELEEAITGLTFNQGCSMTGSIH